MNNNHITCRWHQLNYRPYRPTWLRRQIFLLCGEHWRDLVVAENVSVYEPETKYKGLENCTFYTDYQVRVDYTDKDGYSASEYGVANINEDVIINLKFHKPIVEPMASKDVYLKVI